MRQTWGSNTLDVIYGNTGKPYALTYKGKVYYYVLNLQGDVIAALDSSGVYAAWYVYDTRGKVLKQPSGSNQHPQQ